MIFHSRQTEQYLRIADLMNYKIMQTLKLTNCNLCNKLNLAIIREFIFIIQSYIFFNNKLFVIFKV